MFRFLFWRKPYDRTAALIVAEKARASGSLRKSVRWYRKVLEHDPDDLHVHFRVAPLLARLRRWEESHASFNKSADGLLLLGFAAKAIAVWTVAAQTFPEHVEYWERIANEQVVRGRKQDAILALLEGRRQLRKKRQRPLAVLLLREVLELAPGHVEATLDLADLLRREGTIDEAKRLLSQLLLRAGSGRLRRRVRLLQFRIQPSFRLALDWALAR